MAQKPFSGLQLELFHFGGVFGSDANHVFVQRDEGVQRTKKQQKNRKQASECRSTFSIPTFLTQTATVETYVSAVCRNRTYIPFNPTNGDANNENHIAKQRSEKTKEIFYSWPSIDPSLMHTLPSGESLPLYRWKYRHWLFHRFDEGIQFHVNGFMEVTPEDVARHIARSMRRFVAVNPLFKNQQLKSNPSEQEMPASSAQALDARKEGTAKSLDSGCRDSSGSLNSDLRNAASIGSTIVSNQTKIAALETNSSCVEPKTVEHVCETRNHSLQKGSRDKPESSPHAEPFSQMSCLDGVCGPEIDPLSVIEGCCGYGGNTIQFAKEFRRVVAIDVDKERIQMAQHNAEIYNVSKSIAWITGDVSEWIHRPLAQTEGKASWFFVSPSWGGEGYKKRATFSLRDSIMGCDMLELCIAASKIARNVALYLPSNQIIEELLEIGAKIEQCVLVFLEEITVGLKKSTKYVVAYFLDECAAEQAYPGFGHAVSVLCAKELMEENAMVQWLEWLLKRLGTKHFLSCLKDTIRLCSSGGVKKLDSPEAARSRGGVFFSVVKEKWPDAYRELNRIRKTEMIAKKKRAPVCKTRNNAAALTA